MEVDQPENGTIAELTEAENELYDRQIRLWGLESQKRLRTAKVLVAGLSGIGAEVTKNIILSGVNSVKLLDEKNVSEEDFCAQFLVPRSSVGTNRAEASIERARALNPMVDISADTEPLSEKDPDYFADFDVVVVCGAQNSELLRIDEICRDKDVKFFAADVWGTFGFCFADLQDHSFVEDVVKHKCIANPNEKAKSELVTSTVHRTVQFPPYSVVTNFDINDLAYRKKVKRTGPALIVLRILQNFRAKFERDPSYKTRESDIEEIKIIRNEIADDDIVSSEIFENLFSQISPAAAIVGGVLAQEVIKVVSKKEAPHCNLFLFDPDTCCGFVETIGLN